CVCRCFSNQRKRPAFVHPPPFSTTCRDALRKHSGQCLNCLGEHAFKVCPESFLNRTGLLNPEIAHDECWVRWQRRMLSHRVYDKEFRGDPSTPQTASQHNASSRPSPNTTFRPAPSSARRNPRGNNN
ncbi:unnamed protein product, partial [Pylaiella littoralis]